MLRQVSPPCVLTRKVQGSEHRLRKERFQRSAQLFKFGNQLERDAKFRQRVASFFGSFLGASCAQLRYKKKKATPSPRIVCFWGFPNPPHRVQLAARALRAFACSVFQQWAFRFGGEAILEVSSEPRLLAFSSWVSLRCGSLVFTDLLRYALCPSASAGSSLRPRKTRENFPKHPQRGPGRL